MTSKVKTIELKVVYGVRLDDDGYILIDGVKIKQTNRIVFGTTLDILEHMGYEVKFIQSDTEKEKL